MKKEFKVVFNGVNNAYELLTRASDVEDFDIESMFFMNGKFVHESIVKRIQNLVALGYTMVI